MKKFNKLYFILLLISWLMLPSIVNAASTQSKLVLECPESEYDEKEEGVICSISLEIPEDEKISFKSVSFKLSKSLLGEEASIESAAEDIEISGSFDNGFTIARKNDGSFSSSEKLMVISNITLPSIDKATYNKSKSQYEYTINLTSIKFVDTAKNAYSISEAKTSIRLLSTDATLKSITLNSKALSGFNSKATQYKFTTDEEFIKISAVANNQNATITLNNEGAITKEIKNKEISMDYGSSNIVLTVTSESGATKSYTIYVFRPYYLFPGYDFEFDSKTNTYTLNVSGATKYFAICSYDAEKSKFVKKDNTLCMKLNVLQDVYGLTSDSTTYWDTLKLNGTSIAAEYSSWSEKQVFENMDIETDAEGNQTLYKTLGELKEGANTLSFSINTNYPTYVVNINRSDAVASDEVNTGSNNNANNSSEANDSTTGKTDNTNNKEDKTSTDSTVENPKTGLATYTIVILGIASLAGGIFYYLKKKNLIKKI